LDITDTIENSLCIIARGHRQFAEPAGTAAELLHAAARAQAYRPIAKTRLRHLDFDFTPAIDAAPRFLRAV
jgi:hypothetical protein